MKSLGGPRAWQHPWIPERCEWAVAIRATGAPWSCQPPPRTSPWLLPQLAKKYGPVFTVHLGRRRVVVLWGYEAVKEALVQHAEDFSGRGELAAIDQVVRGFGEFGRRGHMQLERVDP